MNNKIVPTGNELKLKNGTFIVSRSDERGKLIYANHEFFNVSGFPEIEIVGKPHNIIRHPDMPKAVFKLLWETIKSGVEFNGYIKNLCKNGDYYWVFATITTSISQSQTIYYSVRKKPSDSAIQAIIPVYESMLKAEKNNPDDKSLSKSSAILIDEFLMFDITYDEYVLSL